MSAGPTPYVYPLYLVPVSAGFPSPAEDYLESRLNLHDHLIHRPATTFFVRVIGDSMQDAGIRNGDLLIVDRSLPVTGGAVIIARNGDLLIVDRSLPVTGGAVIIAALDGELTLKQVHRQNGKLLLASANPNYPPLVVGAEADCRIWGVATFVIHRLCPPSR